MSGIVVIGSYNRDLVWYVRAFPVGGQTVNGRFSSAHGGKGSNQATACARAARDPGAVTFVAAVGDDAFGDDAVKHYAALGTRTRIVRISGQPTGNAGIFVAGGENGDENGGENVIVVSEGANGALEPKLVPDLLELLSDAETVRIVVMQGELSFLHTAEFVEVLAMARLKNPALLFVFNPAPYRHDYDYARLLPHVDVFCPNETEAAAIAGVSVSSSAVDVPRCLDKISDLVGPGGRLRFVVFTLGANGCRVVDAATRDARDVPAYRAGHVVDTTGAGDCFLGCLVVRLAELLSQTQTTQTQTTTNALTLQNLVAAAEFASVGAGISVTRPGAAPSAPARSEIDAVLSSSSS